MKWIFVCLPLIWLDKQQFNKREKCQKINKDKSKQLEVESKINLLQVCNYKLDVNVNSSMGLKIFIYCKEIIGVYLHMSNISLSSFENDGVLGNL